MAEYRVYLLDTADRIRDYQVIRCETDEDATQAAAALLNLHPGVEVWAGARLVRRLKAAVLHEMQSPAHQPG